MKKTLILLIALVASVGTMHAETYSGSCGENINWKHDTEKGLLEITGYGEMADFTAAPWNDYAGTIKEIRVSHGVTRIGQNAFKYCYCLQNIELPKTITTIGSEAFFNCTSLKEITIPEDVKIIEERIIAGCDSLETIYWNAIDCDTIYYNIKGKKIYITVIFGERVKKVPSNFAKNLWGDYSQYVHEHVAIKHVVFNDSIEVIGEGAFRYCDSLAQNIVLPKHLKTLGRYSFYECRRITGCILPDELINIHFCAFRECDSLKWSCLNIPNSVQVIERAFGINCYDSVRIGEGVRILTDLTFGENEYKKYNDSLKYVEYNAIDAEWQPLINKSHYGFFQQCRKIEKVVIGNKVKKIPDYFIGGTYSQSQASPIKEIIIPNSVTKVGQSAFFRIDSLESIVLSENIDTVMPYAFSCMGKNKDVTLNIPNKIRYIGRQAFDKLYFSPKSPYYYYHINAVPDSARYIGDQAFRYCKFPSDTLFIPQHVDTIYSAAFCYGSNYRVIKILAQQPPVLQMNQYSENVFMNQKTIEVYVPKKSYELYKAADIWKDMNIKTFEDSETPTAIENTAANKENSVKLLRNGQILILRGDKTYTLQGQEVK